MSREETLYRRSESQCELCAAKERLGIYEVPPDPGGSIEHCVLLCNTCLAQIEGEVEVDLNHLRCLNDSMWSQVPAVQVVVWRLLMQIRAEGWPQELLDMLYLEEKTEKWARAMEGGEGGQGSIHTDCNGALLEAGDSVSLIKDLNVKGAKFTAKRGTIVRGIFLVDGNAEQIEGKVNGQRIVILTQFVKKVG